MGFSYQRVFLSATYISAAWLLGTLTTGCATVQPDTGPIRSGQSAITHLEADTDGNGRIDIEEFNAKVGLLFHHHDTNGDEVLSGTELSDVNVDAFNRADDNADNRLSKMEYRILRHFDFSDVDKNDDGVLMMHEVISW